MAAVTIPLRIENPRGFWLAADLLLPSGPGPFPAVIFAHDLLEGRASPRDRGVAGMLVGDGFAVMLLDLTGQGDSEGTLEESTPERHAEDVGTALDQLEQRADVDARHIGAHGSGAGALAVALRAERDPRIGALVLRDPRADGLFDAVRRVPVPTLIIVSSEDGPALEESLAVGEALVGEKKVAMVTGMVSEYEDLAALPEAAVLAADWFRDHLRV